MKAFPTPTLEISMKGEVKGYQIGNEGMDLRDYFAAKAMQATIGLCYKEIDFDEHAKEIADTAYFMADAMMKARND